MTNLDELRREIDGIDDQLLTLLGRRIEIGRAVARSKAPNGGPFLRPGREAAILRRLSAAAPAAIAPAVISRIWRQILVANLAQQTAVTVATTGVPGPILARDHFGVSAEVHVLADGRAVMEAVAAGDALVGVISCDGTWWQDLCNGDTLSDQPRVIARLPFFGPADMGQAVVVAGFDSDPSGDDISLYAVSDDAGQTLREVAGHAEAAAHRPPAGGRWLGSYARPRHR